MQGSGVVSRAMKSLDPLYSQMSADKDLPKEEDQSPQLGIVKQVLNVFEQI